MIDPVDITKARRIAERCREFARHDWFLPVKFGLADSPNGPVIYLADHESGQLYAVAIVEQGIPRIGKTAAEAGFSHRDAVDGLNAFFHSVTDGRLNVDDESRSLLAMLAAVYVSGTRSYQQALTLNLPSLQFLVIRYRDHGAAPGTFLLRPVAMNRSLANPDEVVDIVNQVLAIDRVHHPSRFPGGKILPFRAHE